MKMEDIVGTLAGIAGMVGLASIMLGAFGADRYVTGSGLILLAAAAAFIGSEAKREARAEGDAQELDFGRFAQRLGAGLFGLGLAVLLLPAP